MNISKTARLLALGILPLTGCGWVDSTGNQDGGSTTAANNGIEPGNNLLIDQGAVSVNEISTNRFVLNAAPESTGGWTWRAVNRDNAIALCDAQGDFDAQVALTQLNQACTTQSDCNFLIQEIDNDGRIEFDVTLPALKAPVALSFSLETDLENGEQHRQEQTVCATAINEAPEIVDNVYRTVATQTRDVSAADGVFMNDSDDVHVRNQPLFIKEVTRAPIYAEDIAVNSDGSFRYKAMENLNLNDGVSLEDRIEFIVSDGTHDVESSITMNIVTSNASPALQQRLPEFTVTPTEQSPAVLSENLADYFDDADGDPLQYRLENNELTDAGLLSINDNGVLSGLFFIDNIGTASVTVLVSDGLSQIANRFDVTIRDSRAPNREPTVTDISNERVSSLFQYDVSGFFEDPDGDPLSFTSDSLPPGVNLSDDGLITGVASDENEGRWFISISASDNRGGEVSDRFRLIIDN